jgi:hypothetical protein
MLDSGAFGHSIEYFAGAGIPDAALGPVDEGTVHVMTGHLPADRVDMRTDPKRGEAPKRLTRC